jgi:hypothetical protein
MCGFQAAAPVVRTSVVAALQQLSHLTALQMTGDWSGDGSGAMLLRSLPQSLEVLVLLGGDGTRGPASTWQCEDLAQLTGLRQLRLSGQVKTPDGGAAAAAQQLAGLTRLTALECAGAAGNSQALLHLPSLVAVGTLAGHPDEAAMAALQQLQGRRSLRRLTVADSLSEKALVDLGRLTQLEEVTIIGGGSGGGAGFVFPGTRHSLWYAWQKVLGALTQLQRLQAPLGVLEGETGSDSPLVQLRQLRVLHVTSVWVPRRKVAKNKKRDGPESDARRYQPIRQLAGALVQAKQLQEVQLYIDSGGVGSSELLAVQALVSELLPKLAVTVTTQGPGCCSVVEEVLG